MPSSLAEILACPLVLVELLEALYHAICFLFDVRQGVALIRQTVLGSSLLTELAHLFFSEIGFGRLPRFSRGLVTVGTGAVSRHAASHLLSGICHR